MIDLEKLHNHPVFTHDICQDYINELKAQLETERTEWRRKWHDELMRREAAEAKLQAAKKVVEAARHTLCYCVSKHEECSIDWALKEYDAARGRGE